MCNHNEKGKRSWLVLSEGDIEQRRLRGVGRSGHTQKPLGPGSKEEKGPGSQGGAGSGDAARKSTDYSFHVAA